MEQRTINNALDRARLENKAPDSTYDFRIDKGLKEAAVKVCERNGITLAAFLRSAAAELVREYGE